MLYPTNYSTFLQTQYAEALTLKGIMNRNTSIYNYMLALNFFIKS
jgi:hypothetical protein